MWQAVLQSVFKRFRSEKTAPPPADDRRRMDRIRMLLTIVCQSVENEEPFRIMTENINILGIKFISPVSLRSGEILVMNILLHSNFPNINCNGRVAWCNKKMSNGKELYEGGLEFIGISATDQNYLQKYIDRNKVDDLANKKSYL
jgi:c-di-GMP-binding flagellar brake protein YcgR